MYQRSFVTAQDLAKCANVWDEAPDHASCQHNGGNVDLDLHAVKLLELLDLDETTPTQGETTTTVVAKIFITLRALLLHSDDCNRPALSPPVWLAAATAVLRKALEVAEQAPGSGGLRNRSDSDEINQKNKSPGYLNLLRLGRKVQKGENYTVPG